jgi:hypothetical protein
MTQYTDFARARVDAGAAAFSSPSINTIERAARLSIARRSLVDLPAAGTMAAAQPVTPPPAAAADAADASLDIVHAESATGTLGLTIDSDLDLSSTFDVPAFLRRQDG